jgi:amino acid efflux transporter
MTTPRGELAKTLSLPQAVGLALTIVIGSGLLVLPGLAYRQAGEAAIYAWVLDGLIVIPLLIVFAGLGARYPGAGGVAGFVQRAFSRRAAAGAEVLLLGTFGLGIPAIALTGGGYVAALVHGGDAVIIAAAFAMLAVAVGINWAGAKISGRVQSVFAFVLLAALAAIAIGALSFGKNDGGVAAPTTAATWTAALPAAGLVFFAYTGWEMLAFTAEEYKNPKRDFPLSVAISFVLAMALYLAIALAAQLNLPRDDDATASAPIAALCEIFTGASGGAFTAVLAAAIVQANLIGAMWAASRLIFSSAREGLLPHRIAALAKTANGQIPRAAVAAAAALFFALLIARALRWLDLDEMLRLAGQNFLILYGFCVAAFIKTSPAIAAKVFGVASLAAVAALCASFGATLFYPAALFTLGALLSRRTKNG